MMALKAISYVVREGKEIFLDDMSQDEKRELATKLNKQVFEGLGYKAVDVTKFK
jgi:hypothetical protein